MEKAKQVKCILQLFWSWGIERQFLINRRTATPATRWEGMTPPVTHPHYLTGKLESGSQNYDIVAVIQHLVSSN